ncbi:MAG TPA: histidinol-phosphate transaminase [Polyangiales bacterium]|nr:histidinol-phosphate transaminase [Polyangiales bacterium]
MDESLPGARVHGGSDDPRLVDFSVNLNPYGPCEPVLAAARAAELAHYPDAAARQPRAAWAEALACDPSELAVGHGAADLLWAIARAFLRPGARALIAEPTFSEFRIAAAATGAEVVRVGATLKLQLDALHEADALYLCSPNNPTGEYVEPARIAALARALPRTAIVLDQSFLGMSAHARDARAALPANVIRVRSLTKEFACPGLRIGLCRAQPAWIERIERQRPTWATSSPALAALTASAREGEFVRRSFERMRADRDAIAALLTARGYRVHASETTYQLVEVDDAAAFTAKLRAHGVLVRDCTSFGLPGHVRVAALPSAALAAALDAVSNAR